MKVWSIHPFKVSGHTLNNPFCRILAESFFNLLDTVRRPVKYLIKTDCYRAVLGYAFARKWRIKKGKLLFGINASHRCYSVLLPLNILNGFLAYVKGEKTFREGIIFFPRKTNYSGEMCWRLIMRKVCYHQAEPIIMWWNNVIGDTPFQRVIWYAPRMYFLAISIKKWGTVEANSLKFHESRCGALWCRD